MRLIGSILLIGIGVVLWYWGSVQLVGRRSYLWKLHALGVSDTVGTLAILAGLLVHSLENWPHIVLSMGAVVFMGTAIAFVLARLHGNTADGEEP